MMRRITLLLMCLVLQSCAPMNARRGVDKSIPDRPDALGTAEVKFALPKVERWVMPNGLVVIYKFDDELPRMAGTLYMRGGKLYEPIELAGISAATGSEMRDGSFKGMAPEQLDRTLDRLAAVVETGFDTEFGTLSFSSLSEDFDQVFGIACKVLREPQFDQTRLDLWKKLAIDGIRRRRDDPQTMAGMTVGQVLFGEKSPYTYAPTTESLGRITRERMQEYAKKYIRPNGSLLAVSGAVPIDRVKAALEKNLGNWAAVKGELPPLPPADHQPQPGIYVIERDFDQSTIVMAHLGPPRLTPDVYEMSIYNRVLGSAGFGSRLFDEIRTQLGLAYEVSGGLAPGAVKGTFQIVLGTRSDQAVRAIQKSIEITKDTLVSLPPTNEFNDAKSAVERSFIFRFDSPTAVVRRAAQQELLKYPEDYDATYLNKTAAVTPQMVLEVGQRWVKPDDMAIVIVGKIPAKEIAEAFRAEGRPVYKVTFDTVPKVDAKKVE